MIYLSTQTTVPIDVYLEKTEPIGSDDVYLVTVSPITNTFNGSFDLTLETYTSRLGDEDLLIFSEKITLIISKIPTPAYLE